MTDSSDDADLASNVSGAPLEPGPQQPSQKLPPADAGVDTTDDSARSGRSAPAGLEPIAAGLAFIVAFFFESYLQAKGAEETTLGLSFLVAPLAVGFFLVLFGIGKFWNDLALRRKIHHLEQAESQLLVAEADKICTEIDMVLKQPSSIKYLASNDDSAAFIRNHLHDLDYLINQAADLPTFKELDNIRGKALDAVASINIPGGG